MLLCCLRMGAVALPPAPRRSRARQASPPHAASVVGRGACQSYYHDTAQEVFKPIREFFADTLPGLRPQIAVALTLTITGALRTFDLVWLTTRGGPGTSTITPSFLLYTKAFSVGDVGAAAAIGVVLAASCLLISLLIVRVVERES